MSEQADGMDNRPSLDAATLGAIAAAAGVPLRAEHLEAAIAFNDAMRDDLERLRSVPLTFVGPLVTPLDAIAWIENGGRGSPFASEEATQR